jgi:hypothetical protein
MILLTEWKIVIIVRFRLLFLALRNENTTYIFNLTELIVGFLKELNILFKIVNFLIWAFLPRHYTKSESSTLFSTCTIPPLRFYPDEASYLIKYPLTDVKAKTDPSRIKVLVVTLQAAERLEQSLSNLFAYPYATILHREL